MKNSYLVDWKSTQVYPVLVAIGRELNGKRLHPNLVLSFEGRSDIISDHTTSVRHVSGKELGRRKGLYQIAITGPRLSGTWNFFSGELEGLAVAAVNSATPVGAQEGRRYGQ